MIEEARTELWRRRFFEAQAAAEEFIVGHYGYEGIDRWINENARITAKLLKSQEDREHMTVVHFTRRLRDQLALYDSDISHSQTARGHQLRNDDCGILRYRRMAEDRGVKLTFASPCDYCQKLNSGIYRDYTGRSDIRCERRGRGCAWTIGDV